MTNKLGHLRAIGLLCLLAGCTGGGGDTEGASTGADSTADTTGGTVGASETGEPTPTTGGDTGGAASECDPVAQDCPEGSKCTASGKMPGDEWNTNTCVPEPADGAAIGEPCTVMGEDMFSGIDNCAKGSICLNSDDEMMNGFCVEFCDATMACPGTQGGDGVCIVTNDGALPICLFTCDPLLQDCLGAGACYGSPDGPPFICFNPDPIDGGMDGDPCGFTNACLVGLNCTAAPTQEGCTGDQFGCCAPFCALDEMNCTGAEECVPFFMSPQAGYENVGVCALPG